MNRRRFCLGVLAFPGLASAAPWAAGATLFAPAPSRADSKGQFRFVLEDPLEHPFYWWPQTLLAYPVVFEAPVELAHLQLIRTDTGEPVPVQFSAVQHDAAGVHSATVHFFSDLPSGARREFVLFASGAVAAPVPQIHEYVEGRSIVLDTGALRVAHPGEPGRCRRGSRTDPAACAQEG